MLIQVRFRDNLVHSAQGGWLMIPENLNTVYDLKKYLATEFNIRYSLEDIAISHHEFIFTDLVPLDQVWKIAKNLDIVLKHVSTPVSYSPYDAYHYHYPGPYFPGYSEYNHYPSYPYLYYPPSQPIHSNPAPPRPISDTPKPKPDKHIKVKNPEYTKIKKKLLKILPKVFKKRLGEIRKKRDQMDIDEEPVKKMQEVHSSQSDDSSSSESEQESYQESPKVEPKSSNLQAAERLSNKSDESSSSSDSKEAKNIESVIDEERLYNEPIEEIRSHYERKSPDYNESFDYGPKEKVSRASVNMKELKRNPKLAKFQGKHIKFDASGNPAEVKNKEHPNLNILSPAEEFAAKKAKWKIRPIPRRNPPQLKEGLGKQKVKRFGEYEYDPEKQIKEVYSFNIEDFTDTDVSSLKPGDEILFKTYELSEERLTPQLSSYKVLVI
jgi:hypothetical protein